jgi:hypothetical protein
VSHPNVCRIHEYGEDRGLSFISMAFVEGQDLRRRLAQFPQGLPTAEAFEVAIQAARGLHAIHEAGIIHRDFKTPNIMREASGAIRLMDFGVAKEAAEQATAGLTGTGTVVGTPDFMSPEQCRGEKLDARSDVYSLGVVVFEIFTGDVPFRGDSMMATLFKHIQQPPPLEGPRAARIPAAVVPVLRTALAKLPEQRYASAAEMADALEQARVRAAAAPAPASAAGTAPAAERRADTRLEAPIDVVLKRVSAQGTVLQEERTIADNLGRRGVRVMTSLSAAVGETLHVEELGGDFKARAIVRHRHVPKDGIPRLGLEFVGATAPDRLVQTGEWLSAVARSATPRTSPGTTPPTSPGGRARHAASTLPREPGPPEGRERRSSSRIAIPLEVLLERLSAAGHVLHQERTLAENVGRQGARVLTAMHTVQAGEVLRLREIGGDFETRVTVRNAYVARDQVRRLNLEFLDRPAPDRLVPEVTAT